MKLFPFCLYSEIILAKISTPVSSNALVGSSNNIKSGFSIIACAIPSLCFIPKE